jgi:hypothetical protein
MGFGGEQIGLEIVKGQWKLSGLNELNCMALNIGQHMQQKKKNYAYSMAAAFAKREGENCGRKPSSEADNPQLDTQIIKSSFPNSLEVMYFITMKADLRRSCSHPK